VSKIYRSVFDNTIEVCLITLYLAHPWKKIGQQMDTNIIMKGLNSYPLQDPDNVTAII